MNLPDPGDYIDIHTHESKPSAGVFQIENLMAHEGRGPDDNPAQSFSFGIHPWYLTKENCRKLLDTVSAFSSIPDIIAIGEAGFDKLRGASAELQREAFAGQIAISEEVRKPVVIHCVRAWDELLSEHKKLKPKMPWLVHGFRGNIVLAKQLLSKGMYLSFWFDFVIRPESTHLLKSLPSERIFLETDGAGIDIRDIYSKVSADLGLTVDELKSKLIANFRNYFNLT
jgi:TatD DNase family protein